MSERPVEDAILSVFANDPKSTLHINDVSKKAATFLGGVEPSYNHVVSRLDDLEKCGELVKVRPGYFRKA